MSVSPEIARDPTGNCRDETLKLMGACRVTVAISTFREAYLGWVIKLLDSLENQTLQDFEVIIVVNGNRRYLDRLSCAVEGRSWMRRRINLIFNAHDAGIAHARNMALEASRTRYIAYTDDDAIADSRWLEQLVWVLESSGRIAAATGPVLCKWESGTEEYASWFPKELYWTIGCTPVGHQRMVPVRNGFASNLGLKKDVLLRMGGFDESFGYNPESSMAGEESELGARLMKARYVTLWNPNAMVYHRVFRERLKLAKLLARSLTEGKTKAHLHRLHGGHSMKPEVAHLRSVLDSLTRSGSTRTKSILLLTSVAVLGSYLTHMLLGCLGMHK